VRVISVTRLDGSEFIINSDLIETVEATPDTVISFAHDKKVVVRESPSEIVDQVIRFRRRISNDPGALVASPEQRPTAEQLSHRHKGTGARTNRFHLVQQDDQGAS